MSLHDEYKPTSAPPVEKPQYLFVLIIMATVVLASHDHDRHTHLPKSGAGKEPKRRDSYHGKLPPV